jgi:phosphonate transport system permease protein
MTNNTIKLGHTPEEIRKPSLVPPIIAAIASLILPGLGQALAREVRRGVILFATMISIVLLMAWRFQLAAPRDTGWANIIKKAFRLDPFLIVVTVVFFLLYLWIAFDAYVVAKDPTKTPLGVFVMLFLVYFALGWQIGQIDLVSLVSNLDEAGPALARIAWPWGKAIAYDEEYVTASADIEVPCSDNPPPVNQIIPNQPSLIADPTCGNLSEQQGASGTILNLQGYNFVPGEDAEIIWEDPIGQEFRQRQGGEYVVVVPDDEGYFEVDIIMPYRLLPPSATDPTYIWEVSAVQTAQVGSPHLSDDFKLIVEQMIVTIFIGMMATLFGIVFAVPVSFLAARNLMSASPITVGIYYITRAILNIIRSIEPLIWAIVMIIVVGLGPFAGILALTLHSIAALGKLYSESIESIDPGPIEAVQATGANWLQTVIFAVVPQIVPPFVSFTIYRWDINVRMSTIIGMVGGGGIGFILVQYIRLLDYRSAGMAVWLIAITVAILDYVSAEIRARFV